MCEHKPACPDAQAIDHDAAKALIHDYNLGATRLCNGVLVFDDSGELIPNGDTYKAVEPHRGPALHARNLDDEINAVQQRLAEAAEDLKRVELEARLAVLQARVDVLERTPRGRVFSIDPGTVLWIICIICFITAETWAVLASFVK